MNKKITFTKINKRGEIEEISLDKRIHKKKDWWNVPPAYFNLGMYLAIPLLGGVFLGQFLDKHFETRGLFTIILIILGTISVFYNLIKLYNDDESAHKH